MRIKSFVIGGVDDGEKSGGGAERRWMALVEEGAWLEVCIRRGADWP